MTLVVVGLPDSLPVMRVPIPLPLYTITLALLSCFVSCFNMHKIFSESRYYAHYFELLSRIRTSANDDYDNYTYGYFERNDEISNQPMLMMLEIQKLAIATLSHHSLKLNASVLVTDPATIACCWSFLCLRPVSCSLVGLS